MTNIRPEGMGPLHVPGIGARLSASRIGSPEDHAQRRFLKDHEAKIDDIRREVGTLLGRDVPARVTTYPQIEVVVPTIWLPDVLSSFSQYVDSLRVARDLRNFVVNTLYHFPLDKTEMCINMGDILLFKNAPQIPRLFLMGNLEQLPDGKSTKVTEELAVLPLGKRPTHYI